ncbi:MAG: NAD(P)H-hydrate dehydratase [Bacteroidetes bacterium]|jgi:hydroxyethylthiazole kinase-like uncharacterized protein yjeF|nr:NAD(P)H-hydrate dehydratase [Bacteroidota bacterium]
MLVTNNAQIREIDRIMMEEYAYPGLLLMETAGRKAAEHLLADYPAAQRFLLLCGPGNNGGDGFVTARHLHHAQREVWVVYTRTGTQYEGDAATQFRILERAGIGHTYYTDDLKPELEAWLKDEVPAVVVDALLGTGIRQALTEPISGLIDFLRTENEHHPVVALDVPSGLLGDTGALLNEPLRCAHTYALALPKICHYVMPAANYCGQIHVLDLEIYPSVLDRLGIKCRLMNDGLIQEWYRPRSENTHKGTYGHVLLAGGSKGKAGAIGLSAQAALEIGAGLVTAFLPGSITTAFHRAGMEHMSIPYGTDQVHHLNGTAGEVFASYLEDKSALLLGPGLGHNTDTVDFMREALPHLRLPTVLDADALNILGGEPDLWKIIADLQGDKAFFVLTPHPGEMARLLGVSTEEVQARRFEHAIKLAQLRKVIVVLKGSHTLVAAPNGTTYLCTAGNAGMATAGAGDVLAGAIAGLMSQGYNALKAATMAVYLHARAGDALAQSLGEEGITAGKISSALSPILKQAVAGATG